MEETIQKLLEQTFQNLAESDGKSHLSLDDYIKTLLIEEDMLRFYDPGLAHEADEDISKRKDYVFPMQDVWRLPSELSVEQQNQVIDNLLEEWDILQDFANEDIAHPLQKAQAKQQMEEHLAPLIGAMQMTKDLINRQDYYQKLHQHASDPAVYLSYLPRGYQEWREDYLSKHPHYSEDVEDSKAIESRNKELGQLFHSMNGLPTLESQSKPQSRFVQEDELHPDVFRTFAIHNYGIEHEFGWKFDPEMARYRLQRRLMRSNADPEMLSEQEYYLYSTIDCVVNDAELLHFQYPNWEEMMLDRDLMAELGFKCVDPEKLRKRVAQEKQNRRRYYKVEQGLKQNLGDFSTSDNPVRPQDYETADVTRLVAANISFQPQNSWWERNSYLLESADPVLLMQVALNQYDRHLSSMKSGDDMREQIGWYEICKFFVPPGKRFDPETRFQVFFEQVTHHPALREIYFDIVDIAIMLPGLPKTVLFRKLTGQQVPEEFQESYFGREMDEKGEMYQKWRAKNHPEIPLTVQLEIGNDDPTHAQIYRSFLDKEKDQKVRQLARLWVPRTPRRLWRSLEDCKFDTEDQFWDRMKDVKDEKMRRFAMNRQSESDWDDRVERAMQNMDFNEIANILQEMLEKHITQTGGDWQSEMSLMQEYWEQTQNHPLHEAAEQMGFKVDNVAPFEAKKKQFLRGLKHNEAYTRYITKRGQGKMATMTEPDFPEDDYKDSEDYFLQREARRSVKKREKKQIELLCLHPFASRIFDHMKPLLEEYLFADPRPLSDSDYSPSSDLEDYDYGEVENVTRDYLSTKYSFQQELFNDARINREMDQYLKRFPDRIETDLDRIAQKLKENKKQAEIESFTHVLGSPVQYRIGMQLSQYINLGEIQPRNFPEAKILQYFVSVKNKMNRVKKNRLFKTTATHQSSQMNTEEGEFNQQPSEWKYRFDKQKPTHKMWSADQFDPSVVAEADAYIDAFAWLTAKLKKKEKAYLNLSHRSLQQFPTPQNRDLSILKSADFNHNFITALPGTIQLYQHLVTLDLSHNWLQLISPALGYLSNLQTLNLAHNKLQGTIPEFLFWLPNLQILNLSHNFIREAAFVPSSNLPSSLRELRLSHNQLEVCDESIGLFSELQILDISENRLRNLPRSLGAIRLLKVLKASGNCLTEIPEELARLRFLEEMDFKQNNIRTVSHQVAFISAEKNAWFIFDPDVIVE